MSETNRKLKLIGKWLAMGLAGLAIAALIVLVFTLLSQGLLVWGFNTGLQG